MSNAATQARDDKPYSLAQRIGGWALILLVSVVCFFGTMWLTGGFAGAPEGEASAGAGAAAGAGPSAGEPDAASAAVILIVLLVVLGGVSLVFGVVAYVVTLTTCAFTFDFTRPVWKGFTTRLWFANILAPLGLMGAVAMGVAAVLLGPLMLLGAPPGLAAGAVAIVTLMALQLVTAWVDIWQPLSRRIIDRRLAARGVTADFLATGRPMGTSDPAQKTMKRMVVEQDIGKLWVRPGELRFLGDGDDWTLPRQSIVAIDRTTDPGSMVSYAGGRQVVLRYRDESGHEGAIRLHPQGLWTMGAKKKALDALAAELEAWRAAP